MNVSNSLVPAAIAGLLLGVASCAGNKAESAEPATPTGEAAKHGCKGQGGCHAANADKHGCKGQNACKGQGGCQTDKHACKGQNECKGQGGCKS
jgi:hypothetical protein